MEKPASTGLRDGVPKGADTVLDVGHYAGMILVVVLEIVDRRYYS